ncbi:523_t:CDS:2 [Acaulospora morrowiae]|uniref:523_t:CDS:1 n=1 Tax=Acaulospora morrowiae TaxID=94023 RepID=A0A9N9GFT7_9GLOM|nr:523_t:CDS:2 [Acaulospora morrowiae]
MAVKLPSEIIIDICSYLHPVDLYSLTSTCKRYRSLLWSKSTTTQEIWKTSRIRYIPHQTFPPPEEMCEQQYIWLMVIAQRCRYCGEKDRFRLSAHWELGAYCCDECLELRSISHDVLVEEWKVPDQILSCLLPLQSPPVPRKKYYLIDDVIQTIKEFHELPDTVSGDEWLEERQIEVLQKSRMNKRYKVQNDLLLYEHRLREKDPCDLLKSGT